MVRTEPTTPGGHCRPSPPTTGPSPTPDAVVQHFFGRLPHGLLLNLGAGSTAFEDDRRTVIGVDIQRPTPPHGMFVVADAGALPFRDGSFTGALLKDVIEHVQDPARVLREVRRTAVADARMLLTTPRAIPRAVWDDPTHLRGFTARALGTLAEQGGWRVTHGPRRMGGLPGAGRLGLVAHLEAIMRLPVLGHWFGTNWLIEAVAR